MSEENQEASVPGAGRWGLIFERIERAYLNVLRAVVLILATLFLVCAIWLGVTGLYKISRSPDSVKEAVATVSADEITVAAIGDDAENVMSRQGADPMAEQRKYYKNFLKRYYELFNKKFNSYGHSDDKQLSEDEFDDSFLGSEARLVAISKGSINFERDKGDLEDLLTVMNEASSSSATINRLNKYKLSKKVPTAVKIQKTRTEYRSGWDSYSENCEDWYYRPYGCAVRRAVSVPYTDTVTKLEYPKGTESHITIFQSYQDKFFELLNARRQQNAGNAQAKRNEIIIGNTDGYLSFYNLAKILGAFLILMFFFLLIAIERHQRRQ